MRKRFTGNMHTDAGELAGARPAPRPRRTRARTHASRALTTPHARTNTHTGPAAAAASTQQCMSMCTLQPQHSISSKQVFCRHRACSRQWPGGRPSQHTWQATGSPPTRARGRAAAPASGEARGERGEEMGVARAMREERRARRKGARVPDTAHPPQRDARILRCQKRPCAD